MASSSSKPKKESLSKKVAAMSLEQNTLPQDMTQVSNYYGSRKEADKVNFARLEKGLLLFIYVYENAKSTLTLEMSLWDHRLCCNIIKDGQCPKPREQCRREHEATYRQPNLCPYWYINSCTYGNKCRNEHDFTALSQFHRYLRTRTESDVYRLIRFVRNFAGHYIESAIKDKDDRQELHKEIVIIMVQLVHALSPKRQNSIEHLNLFLEAATVKQLIPADELLIELRKPHAVPEVFLDSSMDFFSNWYQHGTKTRPIDFNQLSPEFVAYFNHVFVEYFEGRLKSRGSKSAWD